jgi:hypothetical protein
MQIDNVLNLFERSMSSLISTTKSTFGADREQDSQRVQVKNVEYIPMAEQGMLEIKANTYSEAGSTKPYQTIIVIDNLDYIPEEEYNEAQNTGENVFELSSNGTSFYIRYSAKPDVKVRCTCEDFRWRFSPYNYSDNSLYGEPPGSYVKKTDRPPVNPAKTPGACKHIIKLKNELERENFFRLVLS